MADKRKRNIRDAARFAKQTTRKGEGAPTAVVDKKTGKVDAFESGRLHERNRMAGQGVGPHKGAAAISGRRTRGWK